MLPKYSNSCSLLNLIRFSKHPLWGHALWVHALCLEGDKNGYKYRALFWCWGPKRWYKRRTEKCTAVGLCVAEKCRLCCGGAGVCWEERSREDV